MSARWQPPKRRRTDEQDGELEPVESRDLPFLAGLCAADSERVQRVARDRFTLGYAWARGGGS